MSLPPRTTNAASACPLPLMHHAYQAAVVGVAVFFAVLVVLREPFRGYQTEVQLTGSSSVPVDPEALREWLKRADSNAAPAISGGTDERTLKIRIGRIAPRLPEARRALDELGRRVLIEYLPQVHSAHRQSIVRQLERDLQLARDAEEALAAESRKLTAQHVQAERTRAEQPRSELAAEAAGGSELPAEQFAAPVEALPNGNPLHAQLEQLRLELSRLLANFTDEHPQVVTLRRQIESLQQQLEERSEPASARQFRDAAFSGATASPAATYTNFSRCGIGLSNELAADDPAALQAELERIATQLTSATAARQSAERKLHATLASLSLESPAAGWSLEPARLVARLGGTPRMLPLILANLGGIVAGLVMFRLATVSALPRLLATTTELSRALPIPLVGHTRVSPKPQAAASRPWITPGRLMGLTRASEIWLVALALACGIAICLDGSLAGQFSGDPLGVLSEIVGRITGR